jgi:hypothetical protein
MDLDAVEKLLVEHPETTWDIRDALLGNHDAYESVVRNEAPDAFYWQLSARKVVSYMSVSPGDRSYVTLLPIGYIESAMGADSMPRLHIDSPNCPKFVIGPQVFHVHALARNKLKHQSVVVYEVPEDFIRPWPMAHLTYSR